MIGIFSKTIDSNFIEASGIAGLDFIILDQEHGLVDNYQLTNHVRAAKVSNMLSIVRVPFLNSNHIGKALDAGASGVMIPNISNVLEAKQAVQFSKFYPDGNRGVCRFVKAANFGNTNKSSYFNDENKKIVIVQVEGLEGIKNLNDILEVEGIDFIFIGPYDLSQAFGYPGEIFHPKILDAISGIIDASIKNNKKVGIFTDTKEGLDMYRKLGVEMLAYSVDVNIYLEALKSII